MAMAMAGRTTTGGSQNGQGPSSSDGYETLQLQIRSVRDTVLLYAIPGMEEVHKYIPCEILNDDMKLIESKYWSHLVNAKESPTFRKEHICFYELWETDTIMQVKTNCSSDFIMGFILVNEAGCVDESFWGNADINVPVCIISRTNCKDLLNHFFASGQSKNTTHQKDVFVKFSAMYGVFSYKCGVNRGDVEFFYPCIERSMVSKQTQCFKLIPDSFSSDEQCFIISEFSCQQDHHYIETILAKKKEVSGIVLFNMPDGQLEMVKSWKSETGIYVLSRENEQQLMTMLESLNAPQQVMSSSGRTSSLPELLVRVLPVHGELKYTKNNKEVHAERIPFTAFADWESSKIRCPPFVQSLHCVDAKDTNVAYPQSPFLAFYVLKEGESNADIYRTIRINGKMGASGIIVMNCENAITPGRSFFSSKDVDKGFPLPLIVISCRHFKFRADLENHKEKLKITLFLQEGKLLFNGKLKDSPDVKVFTRKTATPTDPQHVLFPADAAIPAPSFYFRVCYYSDSVSYASLMFDYEQEVKSGALIGLILSLEGHEFEQVKLPPDFFRTKVDSKLPPIPVLALVSQDAEKLRHHKKVSSCEIQVKESEGRVMRLFRKAGSKIGSMVSAVTSTIAPSATFTICDLFKNMDWKNSTPQIVYFEFSAKLKNNWKYMSDQKEAVLFLKETLKLTGIKHLPIHILAAWSMRKDPNMEADYLQAIYDAAKVQASDVLVQALMAYREPVSQSSEFSYLLQAAEHFVQVPTDPVVLAFWITFHHFVCEIRGETSASVHWSLLNEQRCKHLIFNEENCAILQKWIVLGRNVGINHQYQFNHQNLSLLVLKSSFSSFTSLKIIVNQFRGLVLETSGHVHQFLKTLREKGWLSKFTFAKRIITEGVDFLHDTVMLPYCTDDRIDGGMLNELGIWWQELVKMFCFRLPKDFVACYQTIESVLTNSQCACSAKMRNMVNEEVIRTLQSDNFTEKVTLETFYHLYKEISCISQQVVVAVLKHCHLICLPSEKDPAFKLMNSALERFSTEEMSRVVSSVIVKVTSYQQDGCAFDVLLHMDMPQLFPVSLPTMRSIRYKFTTDLKKEIANKKLKSVVQDCFLKWLDEQKRLQWPLQRLVLEAMLPSLQIGTVDLKAIETTPEKSCKAFQCFQAVMHKMVLFYQFPESYKSTEPKFPYNMLWTIIESSISGIIPATGISECCQKFNHMIKAASPLYLKANEVKALTASLWKEYPPARSYLAWIESILRNLGKLQEKVNDSDWNEDFIKSYQSSESAVADVAQSLHAQVTFVPSQTLWKHMNVAQMQIVESVVKKSDSNTWISLVKILDKFGISLPVMNVSHGTVDPGALRKVDGTSAENAGSVDGRMSIINKKATMKSLMAAVETLSQTLQPLTESMEALVYFFSKKGRLFEKHLGSGLKTKESKSLQDFGRCLANTVDFLLKMTAREVGYKELKDLEFFRLTEAQKLTEIDLLRNFRSFRQMGDSGDDFLSSFKDMTDLLSLMDRIPSIQSVCKMCGLERCLKDVDFEYLVKIQDTYGTPEAKDAMNSRLASDAMKQIRPILPLDGQQLEIFVHLAENEDFYKFIKDIELQGKNRFRSLYTLISSMLQHEEYNDEVLNQLPIARDFIMPFLDEEQDFKGLLKRVVEVCTKARNEFWQLDVMKRNISLVHQWFSKAEDHSLESVVQDIELVVKVGEFCVSSQLGLRCEGLSTHQVSSSHGQGNDGTRCTISEEWIDDFNRRLGLLEKKQVTSASTDEDPNDTLLMNIEIFQLSYKRTKKMSLLWTEMRSLGCPYYDNGVTVPCSSSGSDLDSIELDMKEKLLMWKTMLNTLRSIYKELLLYPIPKIGKIFEAVTSEDLDMILKEIPNIFISHQKNAVQLKQHIQMSLNVPDMVTAEEIANSTQYMELSDCGLFKVVGNFLHTVAGGEFLQDQKYSVQKVVHILPGRSQKETLNLLFSVYGRIPNSFEVYHCRRNTTDKDLQFIFDRAKAFRMTLSIVNVNILSLRLQEILLKLHKQSVSEECGIHYVASGASIVQDLPQVEVRKEPPADHPAMKEQWLDLCSAYKEMFARNKTLNRLELVYGHPGDGKSHYICKKMAGPNPSAVLTFDESFSIEEAIENLQSLSLKTNAVVYFNFTILPANKQSSSRDKKAYEALVTKIQWFLFDLLFLGYVEHIDSGLSFGFLRESQWTIYVEVPNQEYDQEGEGTGNFTTTRGDPERSLQEFLEAFPVLELLGKRQYISPEIKLDIDDDAQLVCKYLKAYSAKDDRRRGIDRKFYGHAQEKVSFARMSDVSVRECHRLLSRYIPSNARVNKLYQMLFVKYMARRCRFLEKCPSYNYNSYEMDEKGKPRPYTIGKYGEEVTIDTSTLGSSLFETMLQEVNDFCSPRRRSNWEGDARQQLVYVLDGIKEDGEEGGSFEVIALKPDDIAEEEKERFQKIQISLHERDELETRDVLDRYIASAFGLKLNKGRLMEIDKKNYVLTLDFALKMLEINERYWAHIPVIIEGETGVGKTFLVEMMADLWNGSLMHRWNRTLTRLWTLLHKLSLAIVRDIGIDQDLDEDDEELLVSALRVLKTSCDKLEHNVENEVDESLFEMIPFGGATQEALDLVMQHAERHYLATHWNMLMKELENISVKQPLIHMLKVPCSVSEEKVAQVSGKKWISLDTELRHMAEPELAARNIYKLLFLAEVDVFHRISIHGSLTTEAIRKFFTPIVAQANKIENKWKDESTRPNIVVFLDEINTASSPGLMKEILVDKSLHGQKLPKSVFVIGACNPHRGHSIVMHEKIEAGKKWDWVKGSYYVHRMHQSVRYLLWDYGALDDRQEENYIEAKMAMVMGNDDQEDSESDLKDTLSEKIAESQSHMREYAAEHYTKSKQFSAEEADELSRSCVSQRDIQRVFTFYLWLLKTYEKFQAKGVTNHPATDETLEQWQARAVMVSLGLTYYFRLSTEYREKYKKKMNFNIGDPNALKFSDALKHEMDFYCDIVHLPPGIAKTRALKENLFCVIACCCTKMPLIIVGEPGSSKTLSFNIAASNFKGADSKEELLKDTDLFPCFDPHYYQCSRTTTSKEVEVVFQRALRRQEAVSKHQYDNYQNTVFMDEAGLPEESLESLKVIHKYLDNPQVAFVGITNHILDAAKTNRTVTLFRPRADKDVVELAHGCFGITEQTEEPIKAVFHRLCTCYSDLMSRDDSIKRFFGLRDFIHFMNYLRRQTDRNVMLLKREDFLASQVCRSVERNFNGYENMGIVCSVFCPKEERMFRNTKWRNIIDVLEESLEDRPRPIFIDDQEDFEEVRYKLIIDPTEDDSSRRMMMMFGILKHDQATTVVGSDFSDDGYLQNINAVSKVTHAASSGSTVLMMQTDEIHESFYDLFNQHFRKIKVGTQKGEKKTHFFANVAIGSHSKPCRVNHNFQCLVVIKESELALTPAPFLNRFEKYRLSTACFLEASLNKLSLAPLLREAVEEAKNMTWLGKDCSGSRRSQMKPFVNQLGEASFFGLNDEDTINSLFVTILPKTDIIPSRLEPLSEEWLDQPIGDVIMSILQLVLRGLENLGFSLPMTKQFSMQLAVTLTDMMAGQKTVIFGDFDSNRLLFDAVSEAWAVLISEDGEVGSKKPSVRFLKTFVISLIHVWVVRKLLQLLTQEAFILHKRTFKGKYSWCLKEYLSQQKEFDVVAANLEEDYHGSPGDGITKLVCFTRSFQAFAKLTSQADDRLSADDDELPVQLCMLSAISSQQEFSDDLQSFTGSATKAVLIILANMFEASKKLINYVRLRIDEIEEGHQVKCPKKFVVLLYFPTSVSQVYPALFLYGWDFQFLDSLDLKESTEYTSQVKHWCSFAYLQPISEELFQSQRSFRLSESCHKILGECGSVLSARVTLRFDDGRSISNREKQKLFKKLLSSPLGETLVCKYLDYWSASPKKVARILHGIAVFSNQLKSLHSITDLFQVYFESTFYNFMAYMIHHINEELDLSTYCEETSDMFLELVEMVEQPKSLASIRGYNNTWGVKKASQTVRHDSDKMGETYSFPAFHKMCMLMENYLEPHFSGGGDDCTQIAVKLMEQQSRHRDTEFSILLHHIDKSDNLLRRYERDFSQRLHLSDQDLQFVHQYMASGRSSAGTNVTKLVELHFVAYATPIDFSHLRKLMMPLLTIHRTSTQESPSEFIMELVLKSTGGDETGSRCLADFIVDSLESHLVSCNGERRLLQSWQDAFQDVCKERELEVALYSSGQFYTPGFRSRFLCVKTVFILMQSDSAPTEEYCKCIWTCHKLLQEEQKQCMENGVQFGLKSILDIVLNKPETAYFRQPIDSILPKFLPELFHHVFHPLLPVYQETDVSDFLEFVLRLPFSKTQDDCTVSLVTLNQVMMRILTCGKNDEEKDEDNYGVFKSRKTSVKQVLASDDAVGEYLPPYYEGSQSTLLAHLYFFSVMNLILGQMADSQKKISECIRAINSLKDTTDHLLAIEKEVCILLLISQVASELSDDKKAAKIENEKKDKIFTKALCRVGNCKGHCEVFEVLLGSLTDKQRAQKILKKVTVWLKVEHKDGKSAGVCSVIKRELVPFSWTKSDILEVLHVHRARNACAKLLCRLIDPDCHEKLMMELKLLPIIVEFCTCLKSLLNFKVDERTARNLDIKTAIEHACDEVTSLDKKEKIRQLLRDFKTYFNDWRKKTPALEEIGGDTPLANILMIAGTTEGQCQTVAVLNSFLNPHNRVVQLAYDCAKDNLMTWFPKPQEIEVHEVENLKHLFPKLPTEAHLLDCMRKCLPVVGRDTDKECVERMCAAVMKEFLVGTPTILEPTAEMIQDLFSLSMKSLSVDRQSNFVFNNELADVHEQLKGCFQNTKESFASHKKDIFAHFHNADHALLECIVRGLLLVAHHLTQEKKPEDWSERPLCQFVTHVQESLPNMMNMTRSTDLRILENLKVRFLEDVLGLFVEWMETGFSDFHSLPLGTKKDPESSQAVYEFLEKKANEFDQKDNLCKLEDVILPDAMGLTMGDFEMLVFEKPLREYVISVHLLKSTSPLLKLIPESIQLKHYVHFMIQLRRVIADHQILSMSESTTDIDESSTDDEAERDPLNLTEIFSRESTLEVVKESEAKEDSDMSDMSDEENTSVTNSVDENSVITSEYTSAKEEEDQSQDIQEDNDSDNHDDYEDLEDADEMDRSRRDMNDSVAVMMDVYGRDDDSDEESGNYDDEKALFQRVPYENFYSSDTFESRKDIVLEDIEELSNGNTGATYESGIVHYPSQGSDSSTHAGTAFQELSQPVMQQITTPSQSWSQLHEDPPHSYGGPPYPHGVLLHPHGDPYQLHGGPSQPHGSSQQPYIGPPQPHGGLIHPHGVLPQPHGNPAQPHGDPPPLDESVPQLHGGPPGGQPHPHGGPPQPHEDPLPPHGDPHGGPPQPHRGKPQPIGDSPQSLGGPLQSHGGPPQPHGGLPQPHGGPPQPHGAPPHGGPPQPHRGPPQPHGAPPQAPGGLPQQYGGPPQPHGGQPQLYEDPPQPHGGQPQQYGAPPQSHAGQLQPHGGLPQSHGGQLQPHGGQQQQYGSQPQQYGGPPQQYGSLSQQPYNSERYHPYSSGYPMQQSYQALPQGYGMPYGYHVGPPISGYPHSSEAPYMSHPYYPQSMRPEDSYGGFPPQPSSASLIREESQASQHSQGGASDKALSMTTDEIICWLEDIGLGEYKELFESEGVDGSLLAELNAEDLKGMGMANTFHCKKLLSKFRKI